MACCSFVNGSISFELTLLPAPIEVGDVVELKSGGPPMTVVFVGAAKTETVCERFNEADSLQTFHFPLACLKHA